LVEYVKRVPAETKGVDVDIVVKEFKTRVTAVRTPAACRRWVDLVHTPFIEGDTTRADFDWDWEWMIPRLTVTAGMRRKPRLFQVNLAQDNFPVGMVSMLEHERWPEDRSQKAVFVWYLTAAPGPAVSKYGAPKKLMQAALDVGVTVALNGSAQGRLWLHAAPEGGQKLFDWYGKQGLVNIASDVILPSARYPVRVNDGRYFQLTPEQARQVSSNMDGFRS
jgi:hypothetical protein